MKMFPIWAKTLLLAGLLVSPVGLLAQMEIEHYERLSLEQGLSDQDIRDIHRDARGFLWLATGQNLERYDGYRFDHFNDQSGGKQQLHGNSIVQLGESAAGCLFIRYRSHQLVDLLQTDQLDCTAIFLDARNLLAGQVQDVYLEERGDLFVLTSLANALVIWRLNYSHLFEKIATLPWENHSFETFRFLKSRTGGFWIYATERGLFQLNAAGKMVQQVKNHDFKAFPDLNKTWTPATAERTAPTAIFYEDRAGRFWLSFKNSPGVYLFNQGVVRSGLGQPWPGFSPQEYFSRIWEDEHGHLLFASPTPGDRFIISKITGLRANGEHYDGSALLTVENKIQDLLGEDFTRQIFLSTYSGLYKVFLKNQAIHQYLTRKIKTGEFGDIVRSITSDGQGHIFFALEERYWYRLDTRTNQLDTLVLKNAQGKPLELISSGGALAYDPAGYLWGMSCIDFAGHLYALHRYDLVRKTTRTYPLMGYLTTFYRQSDGRFCLLFRSEIGGHHMGIFDPRTDEYVPYRDLDGSNPFTTRMPKCILESRVRKGIFWIGTDDGVIAVDMQRRVSHLYGVGESNAFAKLSRPDVLSIYEDTAGALWIGTNGGGLNILSLEQQKQDTRFPRPLAVQVVDDTRGLSNNLVSGILPDGKGGCILSTDLGLNHYEPSKHLVGNFYQQDGLTHNEFDRFSYFKDENDRFYFGTINGLNTFRLQDLLGQKPAGQIRLTKLTKYFGKAGKLEETMTGLNELVEIKIEPEVSYFQLDFMLTDYAEPEKNQFFTWLEGQEKDWSYLGKTHTLRYNRLPAGNYTLHLRGADAQGHMVEVPLSLRIRSQEFFYRTWWFMGLVALALVGASAAIAYWRIRIIQREEKRRSALHARLAELEVRALQAQMNPHFIFNCLNSIQSFIAAGDKENAMRYVTRFAQLTRAVLHFSGKSTIGLDEEIEALGHYLELECLRAGNRIQYRIEVAPDIDTFDTELPPLLVQPFVENSFKHGQISTLNVLFQKTGSQLVVSVQDDGIGLQSKTNKLHQSKGIAITRERLAYWNGRSESGDLRIIPLEKGLLVTMNIQLK